MEVAQPSDQRIVPGTGANSVVFMDRVNFFYGDHHALVDVSLKVGKGEIVGLLGHNGAGKTTTIRLLNGLLKPISGTTKVLGVDPLTGGSELRLQTSVVNDSLGLPERQTARQAMDFHAQLWGLDRQEAGRFAEELLERFGLGAVVDSSIKTYSRGMRQRLALARSMLHRPKLLLLDEPTLGMDPVGRKEFRDILATLRDEGASVLMSTHDLGEVERACQRVVILERGRVLLDGTPAEAVTPLMRNIEAEVEVVAPLSTVLADKIEALVEITGLRVSGTTLSFIAETRSAISDLVRELVTNGAEVVGVKSTGPTLEDVYLSMHADRSGEA